MDFEIIIQLLEPSLQRPICFQTFWCQTEFAVINNTYLEQNFVQIKVKTETLRNL